MKRRESIQYKYVIALIIGCIVPYLLGGLYITSIIEERLFQNSIETTKTSLKQMNTLIDETLVNNIEENVVFLSNLPSVVNSMNKLRSYVDDTNPAAFIDPIEAHIYEVFKQMKNSHPDLNFLFLGTEDGGYMEFPSFRPQNTYDPRKRPWYKKAIASDELIISEPYISSETQDMIVSFSMSVKDGQRRIGVLGISVNLDRLLYALEDLHPIQNGTLFLLSKERRFLLSADHPEWLLKTPAEVGFSEISSIPFLPDHFQADYDNEAALYMFTQSELTDWILLCVIPESSIHSTSRQITQFLTFIYFFTLLTITIVVLLITRRITKPILNLSDLISKYANFRFNDKDQELLDHYTRKKDEIGVISNSIKSMNTNMSELIQNLTKTNQEIHFLAFHDSLTQLPNRLQFIEHYKRTIHEDSLGAVLLLDLDNFKVINDSLGHYFGDMVLEEIAQRLRNNPLENAFISRFGGDEFLILLEYKAQQGQEDSAVSFDRYLAQYIQSLLQLFERRFEINGQSIELRFSMGISLFPKDSSDINELFINADLAMYKVKQVGRNHYQFYDPSMRVKQQYQQSVELMLRDAIREDGFTLVYQPQVHLSDRKIHSFEALLRMKDHSVSPGVFIPIAESAGLIPILGRIVTQKVIEQQGVWKKNSYQILPIAINFSALQLKDLDFINYTLELLEKHQIESRDIEIEFTENIILENQKETLDFLQNLRNLGFKLSIDDFGTGYSSLNYLTFLPVDKIKLDRSLNLRFLEHGDLVIMESIITLIHSLGFEVVAEGIEEEEHVQILNDVHCDYIQGYYFSPPVAPTKVEEMLSRKDT